MHKIQTEHEIDNAAEWIHRGEAIEKLINLERPVEGFR